MSDFYTIVEDGREKHVPYYFGLGTVRGQTLRQGEGVLATWVGHGAPVDGAPFVRLSEETLRILANAGDRFIELLGTRLGWRRMAYVVWEDGARAVGCCDPEEPLADELVAFMRQAALDYWRAELQ